MFPRSHRSVPNGSLFTLLLLTAMVVWIAPALHAQKAKPTAITDNDAAITGEPIYREYKGVHIGMSCDEARQKLGAPQEKGDKQDFYVFSDKEMAQVFYEDQKVIALSINYVGESGAPVCKNVLGTVAEAKPDGSMHKLVRYPKAGYWVSYSRTAGDSPLITVTMQKISAATQ